MGAYQTEKDGPITIIGTLKKRNGKFVISGTYESTFTDEGNLPTIYSYPVSGTFEMVQK